MRMRLYDSARKVMARLALDLLADTPGDGPVLDLGCGPGLIANWLGERQPRPIHGIDIGARSIAAATEAAAGANRFAVYDGECIPYPDANFDAVLCLEVIEHVETDREMLAEIVRVLRPGGRLLLSTTDADEASLADKPHHVRHYRAAELRRVVEEAGLVVDRLTHRYHPIGFTIDRMLTRMGSIVSTDELDDEAVTVSSAQPMWVRVALAVYDLVFDPVISALVWAEYRAPTASPRRESGDPR